MPDNRSPIQSLRAAGRRSVLAGLVIALLHAPGVQAQVQSEPMPPVQSNGRLLYETHCIACHDKQVHWRDARLSVDWNTLDAQVRRWQANALLSWSEADITAVTRFLNETIYRFPRTGERLSRSVRSDTLHGTEFPTM